MTKEVEQHLFNAARAHDRTSFDVPFSQLPEVAQDYLNPLIPHFSNFSFDGWRFDQVTSNLAESFCATIKPFKRYPPLQLFVHVYHLAAKWINQRVTTIKPTQVKLPCTDCARKTIQERANHTKGLQAVQRPSDNPLSFLNFCVQRESD